MHHLKDHLPTAGLTPGLGIDFSYIEGMSNEEMFLSKTPRRAKSAPLKFSTALNKFLDQVAPVTSRLSIQILRHTKIKSEAVRVVFTSIFSLLFAGYIFASLATLGILGKTAMAFVASFLPVVAPALSVIAAFLFALICVPC